MEYNILLCTRHVHLYEYICVNNVIYIHTGYFIETFQKICPFFTFVINCK